MLRPIIGITDVQTGENIVREMNDEEYAQYLIDKAAYEAELEKQLTE
jgi:hypothetical protein